MATYRPQNQTKGELSIKITNKHMNYMNMCSDFYAVLLFQHRCSLDMGTWERLHGQMDRIWFIKNQISKMIGKAIQYENRSC